MADSSLTASLYSGSDEQETGGGLMMIMITIIIIIKTLPRWRTLLIPCSMLLMFLYLLPKRQAIQR